MMGHRIDRLAMAIPPTWPIVALIIALLAWVALEILGVLIKASV